jgi:type I restriction enzyme M protein
MFDTINQNKINAILLNACDLFRDRMLPSTYKDYVIAILFVKYISVVWYEKDNYQSGVGE